MKTRASFHMGIEKESRQQGQHGGLGELRKGSKQSLVMTSLKEFRKNLCGTELDVATFISIHMCHKNVPTERYLS